MILIVPKGQIGGIVERHLSIKNIKKESNLFEFPLIRELILAIWIYQGQSLGK